MAPIKYQVVNQFKGYEHKKDITNSDSGILVRGTKNVLINDYEKIFTRKGITLKGQTNDGDNAIQSSYDDFVNVRGIKLPIREYQSTDPNKGNVYQIWYQNDWRTITANPNILPPGTHESNFAEWWDPVNELSRLNWVNGTEAVMSWTGGIGEIVSATANTISIDPTLTWEGQGFDNSPGATNQIVINGIVYTFTGGITTDTLTGVTPNPVANGVGAGDLAFDQILVLPVAINGTPITGINWDICSSLYNQMYYGSYSTRGVYVSHIANDASQIQGTIFTGTGLNDATFSGLYTGNTIKTYKVIIDSTDPASQSQTFVGGGANDVVFDTTGYTGIGNNTYQVAVVANFAFTFSGTPAIIPAPGDILTGGTSNAVGRVMFLDGGGQDPVLILLTPEAFVPGETISGSQGTPYGTVATATSIDWFQLFKNNVAITPTAYSPFVAYQFSQSINPVLFTDGLSFSFSVITGHDVGSYWNLNINSGGPDTFQWSDGGSLSSPVAITGAAQALSDGVDITFTNLTGHTVGDQWTSQVIPQVNHGWVETSFSNPRIPGEGALLLLDSPPIGMRPQEDAMYLNSRSGSWFITQFTLSSTLTNESLTIQKLKSEPQTQILHHNLLSSIKNSLVFVSKDKTFDTLGRLALIQTPQSLPISDRVRDDFLNSDFTNGSIKFFENKTYISAPNSIIVYVFDHILDLWQPPQTFPVGRLAIIDDKICGHSSQTNETYTLFDGPSDNGQPIESIALFAYEHYGSRANLKSFNEFYVEGYIRPNTTIDTMIRYEIDGCGTQTNESINGNDQQIVCIGGDDRSLGKKSLGIFSLAALRSIDDPDGPFPKFRVIQTMPRYNFFEVQYGFSSYGLDQKWALLAFGPGAIAADERNNYIKQ